VKEPTIQVREGTGELVLGSLEEPFVGVLLALPNYLRLAKEHPRARARLLPSAYDDATLGEEWTRHAVPEISHLFESASHLVEKDLASLVRESPATHRIVIPGKHHGAWMTSLNAARLTIGEIFRLKAEDLDPRRPLDPASERDSAIFQVNLLGWLEELLVSAA
jgi:uncharacterized protein DUF2017